MAQLQIKRGLYAGLATLAHADGQLLFTTDTKEIFVDDGTTFGKYSDVVVVANAEALPAEGNNRKLYIVDDVNAIALWNGTGYTQINVDTGATSVEFDADIPEGEDPTSYFINGAVYDDSTRSIVFSRAKIVVPDVEVVDNAKEAGKVIKNLTAKEHTITATWDTLKAEEVIMDSNLTLTANVGVHTMPSSGSKTLETKGKSVKQVMDMLFAQEKNPTKTAPSFTLTSSGNTEGEVGTTFTMPTATLKMTSVGSYTYGPATGINVPIGDAFVMETGDDSTKVTNSSAMVANSTITATATNDSNVYSDSVITFNFNASATHSQGAMPVTNLGNDYASARITSATVTKTASATRTGYRAWFYGGDAKSALDSTSIRALTNKGKFAAGNYEVKAASYAGCTRIVVAIPASLNKSITQVLLKSASNATITGEFKAQSNVAVADASGANPVDYKVWVYEPASLDASEVYTITVG